MSRYLITNKALHFIDEYLDPNSSISLHQEKLFKSKFNSDLNAYLKYSKLGDGKMYSILFQKILNELTPSEKQLIVRVIKTVEIQEHNSNNMDSKSKVEQKRMKRPQPKHLLNVGILPPNFIMKKYTEKHGTIKAMLLGDGRIKLIENHQGTFETLPKATRSVTNRNPDNIWDNWYGEDDNGLEQPLSYFRDKYFEYYNLRK